MHSGACGALFCTFDAIQVGPFEVGPFQVEPVSLSHQEGNLYLPGVDSSVIGAEALVEASG